MGNGIGIEWYIFKRRFGTVLWVCTVWVCGGMLSTPRGVSNWPLVRVRRETIYLVRKFHI